jgi:hypothetical protein
MSGRYGPTDNGTGFPDDSLFGATGPLARNSDPDVSHRAKERATRGMGKSKARMLSIFATTEHATGQEAALALHRLGAITAAQIDSHRRRAPDLCADGFLELTGTERGGLVYRITEHGRKLSGEVNP